ncbi:hypothetical protein [Thalassolituus hydrocarboniclasticus]|uniref:DUF3025 domain-containing protein n=1 Tax=Thalassolituus hydrocarboniclasticus TaxID=2742796 RepID=A0ABY6AHV4_9GAMM|nr:hypothetical protein [Thalassolituus hydrocarboniclasticus]UXD89153.1 hypothetical protein HUF19_17675 [Thalassolituus hydrocarboniclasticus]
MSNAVRLPPELVYLPLGEEAIPLLKRGFIPLLPATASGLPWLLPPPAQAAQVRISAEDYLSHMHAEYERLPENLRSLISRDDFLRQAESKRADIEAALVAQRKARAEEDIGKPEDWLLQRFFSDPYCPLAWSYGAGFSGIWLGIDPQYWPDTLFRPVSYQLQRAPRLPDSLCCDPPHQAILAEQRLICARESVDKSIQVGQQRQWLLRLPPKALRMVLLGAQIPRRFEQGLLQFWQQDFRYQRIPLAQMRFNNRDLNWEYQLRPLTRAENP